MSSHTPRLTAGVIVAATVVSLLVACGGSKKTSAPATTTAMSTTTSTTAANSKISAEVPAKFKGKTVTVATDATYAPNEFVAPNGHTIIGMDPDLAQALGSAMGVKMHVVNATFDSIIPGLASGKYDVGMSSFGDTKERQKVVDFVTYFSAGTSFYVKASGGPTINGLSDLCGKTVAVEKGTTQAADVTTQNGKCGGKKIKLLTFPDQNGANLAISSGRAQVGMADSPPAAYIVKQSHGQFKLVGKPYGVVPYGIALPKNSGLAKPILDALKALQANGQYMAILRKWGIQSGANMHPVINGAIS